MEESDRLVIEFLNTERIPRNNNKKKGLFIRHEYFFCTSNKNFTTEFYHCTRSFQGILNDYYQERKLYLMQKLVLIFCYYAWFQQNFNNCY